MDQKALQEFWGKVHRHPVKMAREIFPERGPRYVAAAHSLGNYAINRAAMLSCKARGDEHGVAIYKRAMDICKADLPLWAD
jgi:molybdopterin synthase catalytic subunit